MIGNKVCFFQSLESTNSFMKEHLKDYRDGNIVVAKMQTAGRGRRSNKWVSYAGNLFFSFLVRNQDYTQFDLVKLVSLSVCDALNKYGVKASIKYPNDILVDNKKICGILIERILGENDDYVVGVGVNVLMDEFDDINQPATSIKASSGNNVDYRDVLSEFINEFNGNLSKFTDNLHKEYLRHSSVLGKNIMNQGKRCVVKTINTEGSLVLNCEGREELVQLSEITVEE